MTGGKMSILEDKDKQIKSLRQQNLMKKILLITHSVGSVKQEKTKGVPYKITSWNAVHDVIKEKLLEHEVLIIPFIKEHTKEGNLTTVKCYADIIDTNTGEQLRIGDYVGYGIDQSDKGCGKATTYAYKYLLMKLFMLEVGENEDSEFSNPTFINNQQLGKVEKDI